MKSFLLTIIFFPLFILGQNHILITEIVVTPTAGEFVEIHNNTGATIDLTNYYLTDATYSGGSAYYYNIVTGTNAGGGSFGDFHARFPAGASIASGEFQTIAVDAAGFVTAYGMQPNYELNGTDGSVPDMLEAISGSINAQGGITNSGEVMIIYYWDGQSDLVQDIDYVVWGDKNEAIDKSGISIDGPDPDSSPTTYLNDTAISSQISVSSADPHNIGESIQRIDLVEHSETQSGGNGITGNDETSEDLATSFPTGTPNPGSGPSGSNAPLITNITQSPAIPTPDDTVFVTSDVTDNGTIVNVKLFISINGAAFDSTIMTILSGDTYESYILPQSNGTQIDYYIKAEDNDGEESSSSIFNYTVSAGAAPIISNIIHIPSNPTAHDTVKINVNVTDNDSVTIVKLFTSIDSAPIDSTDMILLTGDTYESIILPQTAGTSVSYYISAEDNDGLISVSTNYSYTVNSGTSGGTHLIFTEITVVPTAGEFVEIYNNTNSTIDLSNYYLTDATYASGSSYYYNIVTGTNAGGGDFGDFHAQFPAGSSITPGEYQTVAMDGAGFVSTYGVQPTYELYDTNVGISDMLEALSGSINNQGGLTNSGEMAVLYYWDGQSDLVQDIDYAVWGDKAEAVDKSGISIDGPDPDIIASSYLNDTPIAQQISISSADPHSAGESIQRLSFIENSESQSNGNGITGHDETSEDLPTSFQVGNPNPGTGPTPSNAPVLSNISQQPAIPSPSDSVTISADVTDNGTIVSVKLFTSINSSPFDSTDMNLQSGDTYQGLILPQADGTPVQYYIIAVDNEGLSSTSLTFNFIVTTSGGITPIANIQNNPAYIGQQVTIEGVVTLGAGVTSTSWTSAYVQDRSGRGINIYQSGNVDLDLVRKNLVQISGTVEEFSSGITEIVNYSIQIIDTNQTLPAPLQLSTFGANDLSYEGTYILVNGIIVDMYSGGGGTTIRVDDGSGSIDFRAWDTAGLILDSYSAGDTVSIKGVMGIYQGNAQISLAYQDEIYFSNLEISGEGSGEVSVTPDIVNTGELVSLDFSFTGTSNDTVSDIEITIPQEWSWTGNSSDVTSSGGPFNSVNVSINANTLTISNAVLENNLQGSIIINNLTAPAVDTVSQFIIKTGNASRVTEIENQPIVLVGTGTQVATTPIDSIQTDPKWIGQTVTIKAVVSIGAGILRTDYTDSYVQDSTGYGLNVFSFDPPDPEIVKGNLLILTGLVEEYNGITELTNYSIRLLRKNNPIPGIKEISTISATDVSFEGSYVKVTGTIIDNYSAGGGSNIIIDDGTGEVSLRIWDTAELDLSGFEIGDGIVAYGVVDLYEGVGQVLIGYQEDIQHIVLPKVPQFLKLPNRPFVPDRGEILVIRYSAGSEDTHTTMRIYDLSGRLVTTLLDGSGRSFEQQIPWNGRDQLNDFVPLGTYILHYEVVNNTTGKRWQKAAPIVVGTVLR